MKKQKTTQPRYKRLTQYAGLQKCMEISGTEGYYWSLSLLWPNVDSIIKRLYEYVGDEISLAAEEGPFLAWVLKQTAEDLTAIKKTGVIREDWRDRDILVFFLRSLTRNMARLYNVDVQAGGELWPCGVEYFTQWRSSHEGDLQVSVRNEPQELTTQALRKMADKVLSTRDWKILAEDSLRLWSESGLDETEVIDVGDAEREAMLDAKHHAKH